MMPMRIKVRDSVAAARRISSCGLEEMVRSVSDVIASSCAERWTKKALCNACAAP